MDCRDSVKHIFINLISGTAHYTVSSFLGFSVFKSRHGGLSETGPELTLSTATVSNPPFWRQGVDSVGLLLISGLGNEVWTIGKSSES